MATGHWPALKERKIKKNFIRLISILFLISFFVSCNSTQIESNSTESLSDNNQRLVLYCTKAKETYYLEDEKEIKNILHKFPKIISIGYLAKTFFVLNSRTYYSYFLYLKKGNSIQKEIFISTDSHVWAHKGAFMNYHFSKKNIEKIIAKMHKGIKHTETIEDLTERRQFIEGLRADDNVLYIDLRRDFDFRIGSFYIYVPASEDENIDSREIVDNLREHYGDRRNTLSKEIHNYSYPKRTQYIKETQEIEFEMSWTKEMYDKLDIYRKSEFREENYKTHQTFDYYTKE